MSKDFEKLNIPKVKKIKDYQKAQNKRYCLR